MSVPTLPTRISFPTTSRVVVVVVVEGFLRLRAVRLRTPCRYAERVICRKKDDTDSARPGMIVRNLRWGPRVRGAPGP